MASIRDSLNQKVTDLLSRGFAQQTQEVRALQQALAATSEQLKGLHDEMFEWCGEISARCGELTARFEELSARYHELATETAEIKAANLEALEELKELADIKPAVDEVAAAVGKVRQMALGGFDPTYLLRQRLLEARASREYALAFETTDPLVSVCIATYNRCEELVHRTIASVLAQTYQNFEVIVVGDGCTDGTETEIAALGDSRVRFVNLPHRGVYPDDPVARWHVAGTPGANLAAELAEGMWIARIDDDDEFVPEHIEMLLRPALAGRFELFYGRLRQHFGDGHPKNKVIGVYPPQQGEFNFGGAIYLKALSFFEFDIRSWMIGEPGDWHLGRRMLESGVRIGFTEDVVTTLFVTGPRPEGQ